MTIPITGITLEGYQVFEKSTFIPLDKLTFTFGPNSAGKSALQDGIALGEKLLKSKAIKFDISNIFQPENFDDTEILKLLQRHWRRQPGNIDSYSPSLKIAIHQNKNCTPDEFIATQLGKSLPDGISRDYAKDLEVISHWHFYHLEIEDGRFFFQWDYELHINSELCLSYIGDTFSINLGHAIIKDISGAIDINEALAQYPDHAKLHGQILSLKECVFGFQPSGVDFYEKKKYWLNYPSNLFFDPVKIAENDEKRALKELVGEIGLLAGCIICSTQGNTPITLKQVSASRNTPTQQDLVFEVGNCDDHLVEMPNTGDKNLQSLAKSLASTLMAGITPKSQQGKLADDINRALADHLFLDQGYQLDFDYRVLLSKFNSEAIVNEYELQPSELGYLIQIFVKDNHGRRHRIEDVGSGIGYLLPVLSATYDAHWSSAVCAIQQPELHIHPALQANLGDIFIEASNFKQLIIETHSEHLLLRVLKRIRQTHSGTHIAADLKIQAKDVCVLYFDPSTDGCTYVRHLRISHDGEFMDRWPRGFFAERDQELFDE